MKTLSLLAILFLSACAFGSTNCQSTFTVNPGKYTAFQFCVTENGNVLMPFQGLSDGAEGYAICVGPTGVWDLGAYGDSGGWQASVIDQPNGPNTFPLTITRTAQLGQVLTQTFSIGSGGKSVHVKMDLNGGGGALLRFAHVSITGSHADATRKSAFIIKDTGVMASPAVTSNVGGGIVAGSAPANPCNFIPIGPLPYQGDAATLIGWSLAAHKKSSVSFDYVPMR